ncbi:hypothetical protein [Piscirickettsia salmonis]|uniref:hypothetical protein n=1 Tax=Piscirickettsia salmonis TaxID=1238 RepID=UPI0007C95AC8|nr:hypothetical protein A0O36_01664 [Piscirickettsiaceae bacterium NZ-RLO1]
MRRKVFVFDLTSITPADRKYQQRIRSIIKNILKNGDKVVFTAVKDNMSTKDITSLSILYRYLAEELGLKLKKEPNVEAALHGETDKEFARRQLEVLTEYLRDPIEIADDRDFTAGLTAENKRLKARTEDKKKQPSTSLPEEDSRSYQATPEQHAAYKREFNRGTSAFSFRSTPTDNKSFLLRDISVNSTIIGVKSLKDVVLIDNSPQTLKAAKSAHYTTVAVKSTHHLGQLEAMVAKQTQAKQQLIKSIQKHLAGLEKYQQKQPPSPDPDRAGKAENLTKFIDKTQALLKQFETSGQKVSKAAFDNYKRESAELIQDLSHHKNTGCAYQVYHALFGKEVATSGEKTQKVNNEVVELMQRSMSTISPGR